MNYEQAFEALKRGERVAREGRTLILRRGLVDVTDANEPKQAYFSEEDRSAEDWETVKNETAIEVPEPDLGPEPIAPEAVDEALHETTPEEIVSATNVDEALHETISEEIVPATSEEEPL